MAYKQQKFISHSSKAGKSKIKAHSVSGEDLLPGSQMAVFSLCPHVVEGVRELPEVSFIGAQIHL